MTTVVTKPAWMAHAVKEAARSEQIDNQNKQAEIDRHHHKLRGLLFKIFPDEAAAEIVNSGEVPTDPHRMRLGNTEFSVTEDEEGLYIHELTPEFKVLGEPEISVYVHSPHNLGNAWRSLKRSYGQLAEDLAALEAPIQQREKTLVDPDLSAALADMKIILSTIERGGMLTTYHQLILDTLRWVDSLTNYIDGACSELADLDGNSDDLD